MQRLATGPRDKRPEFESQLKTFLSPVRTATEDHPTSYAMPHEVSWLVVKRLMGKVDHSPQVSEEINNTWIYTSTSPYAFIANFTLSHKI
jgi:hypothetical protein